MDKYEIIAELNLKNIIAQLNEVVQVINEFADALEKIEKKYNTDTIPWATIHDAQAVQQKMMENFQ